MNYQQYHALNHTNYDPRKYHGLPSNLLTFQVQCSAWGIRMWCRATRGWPKHMAATEVRLQRCPPLGGSVSFASPIRRSDLRPSRHNRVPRPQPGSAPTRVRAVRAPCLPRRLPSVTTLRKHWALGHFPNAPFPPPSTLQCPMTSAPEAPELNPDRV